MNLTWIILCMAVFHSIRINELRIFVFISKINEMPSSRGMSCAQSFLFGCACARDSDCVCVANVSTRRARALINARLNEKLLDGALSIVRYQASWRGGDMNKTCSLSIDRLLLQIHCRKKKLFFNEFTTAGCTTDSLWPNWWREVKFVVAGFFLCRRFYIEYSSPFRLSSSKLRSILFKVI